MRAVGDGRPGLFQHGFEQVLAIDLRDAAGVHALQMKQIEQHVRQRCVLLAGERGLQHAEVGLGTGAGDQFAVQRGFLQSQLRQRIDDLGHLRGPLQRIARPDPHLSRANDRQQAIAIPLGLVQPVIAHRRRAAQHRQLGFERSIHQARAARAGKRQRALAPLFDGARGNTRACSGGGLARRRLARFHAWLHHPPPARARGRCRHVVQHVVGLAGCRVVVLVLEQQPLRPGRGASGAHQVPTALELVAEQFEAQVTLRQLRLGIAAGGP